MVNGDPAFNGGYTPQQLQSALQDVGLTPGQLGLS
jgi:hypothetical protein